MCRDSSTLLRFSIARFIWEIFSFYLREPGAGILEILLFSDECELDIFSWVFREQEDDNTGSWKKYRREKEEKDVKQFLLWYCKQYLCTNLFL